MLPTAALLNGSVENTNGRRISGASIQVTAEDGARTTTVANADGAFEVNGLPAGRTVELVVNADGYKETRLDVETSSRGSTKGVSVTMEADIRVSGRVIDLEGYPVPNIETQFVPRASSSEGWYRRAGPVSTMTDEQGRFRMEGLPPGTYSLRFSHARFTVEALEPIEIEPREHTEDLVLVAPYAQDATIHGRVTDEEGNPVPEVTVSGRTIYGFRRTNLQSKQEASAKTDEQGWYALEGIVDPVDILFMPPEESGLAKAWTNNVAPSTDEVNATLSEVGALSGMVVDAASGTPIPDFKVLLWSTQDAKGEVYPDRPRVEAEKPGEPGRFTIAGLTPGLVMVWASARDHAAKLLRDIPVSAGGRSAELRIALGEPCILKAPFTVDGKPNESHVGLVEAFSTDTPRLVSRFHMYFSEGQPVITVTDLPEGTYLVLGTISDKEIEFNFRSSQRTTATLVPGQTTRLNFDFVNRSGIRGRVTAPIGSAHCVVVVYDPSSIPTQPSDCLIYGLGEYRITGETGEYMIPYLKPGQYLATAYCSEAGFDFHRAQSFPVTLDEDAVTEVDFDLTSGNVTSGLPR